MSRSVAPAERPARFARVLVWTLPAANVLVAIGAQLLVPRLLQLDLSESDYTAYVALTSVAAYVGLGEGGVLVSLLRELSARHGARDRAGFALEARRARTLFVAAALVGGGLAAVALGTQAEAFGARGTPFVAGAIALVAATMLDLALGSDHSAMLFSTGRLLLGQLAGTATVIVPIGALVLALALSRSLVVAVWAQALAALLLAVARGLHANAIRRIETFGVVATGAPAPLQHVVGPGALLKLAEVMQSASYPHLLAVVAPALVPGAIPARTYANATKLVTQQFVNLLQVHVTRGLAGDAESRTRAREQYALAATFLTSAQLLQLAVVAALAHTVFALWLPNQAVHVSVLLPGMFAWQALLAASLPTDILYFATGHMRLLGLVRIAATILGLGTVALAIGPLGYGALGVGLAVSALPLFAFGLWGELGLLRPHAPRRWASLARYGGALAAAAACLGFGAQPWTTAAVCGGIALIGLPRSTVRIVRWLRR